MQMQLPVSFSISRKKASLAQAEIAPQPRESGGGVWCEECSRVGLFAFTFPCPRRGQTNFHVHSCGPAELFFVP